MASLFYFEGEPFSVYDKLITDKALFARYKKEQTKTVCSTSGGKGGIRTPGTVARSPHFECGPFDHSGTFPVKTM